MAIDNWQICKFEFDDLKLTITKQSPNQSIDNRQFAIALTLIAFLVAAGSGDARQSREDIARRIVIGQAYVSGNVYVAGFDADEKRSWPRQITLVPLHEAASQRWSADFFRTVTQDSEEQYYFPRRESDGDLPDLDIFATVDGMALEDRNLARYRAADSVSKPVALFGWDARLPLSEISFADKGQLRPPTAAERSEIETAKKSVPKSSDCTTVPRFLDAATVLLTARVASANATIRLSQYATPGCAGHLSEIYVLDVIVPGQEPRRFEFRHYQGVI